MTPATDCPPCPRPGCGLPCGVPFATHQHIEVRDPRHLICAACGHDWIETDLDRVAQSWRAEAAEHAEVTR